MEKRYLLQQPQKLEDMAIEKLAVWIGIQGSNMKSTIAELHKIDATKAETALSQQIETIRYRFQCNLPRMLYDVLLTKTVAELYRLSLETSNNKTEIDDIETSIIVNERMVETLFTKHVKTLSLSFDQFNMLRRSLCSKSHLLAGLLSLDLNSNKPYYSIHYTVEIEDEIIQIIEKLHSLKYLNLLILDADRIVKRVVKNCPLIEELVLQSSYPMNDDTIKLFSQLVNLRSITLGTQVNSSGYEIILLNCKNMEHITCLTHGERIKMSEALIRIASKPNAGTLNLKSYSILSNTKEELEMIFRTCPLIQNLIVSQAHSPIYYNNSIIMAITDLKNLRELTLQGTVMYPTIMSVLDVVGCNLEHLSFIGRSEIDLNAMIEITQMCPNLQSFCLVQFISWVNMQGSKKRELTISPFEKLKKLTLNVKNPSNTAQQLELVHEPIFFALSNCTNVEFIEFHMPNWFTENSMLQVLDKNPLTYLKNMKILYSNEQMTTLVMEQIIKNCINEPEVIRMIP